MTATARTAASSATAATTTTDLRRAGQLLFWREREPAARLAFPIFERVAVSNMNPELPPELWWDIFGVLDIAGLAQCRAVCRAWGDRLDASQTAARELWARHREALDFA